MACVQYIGDVIFFHSFNGVDLAYSLFELVLSNRGGCSNVMFQAKENKKRADLSIRRAS